MKKRLYLDNLRRPLAMFLSDETDEDETPESLQAFQKLRERISRNWKSTADMAVVEELKPPSYMED